MKTADLTGAALDWAAAKAGDMPIKINPGHGFFVKHSDGWEYFTPSTDWDQGGPIIERTKMDLECSAVDRWRAALEWLDEPQAEAFGPTPLIAAMRCFVASKLGDEVEIPKELMP